MKDICDYIDAHANEFVADLQTFVQQPSISAQDIGLRECATLIRDMMNCDGLTAEFHELEEGPPVVYGEVPSKSPKTLLCYSHYDVQPPEPIGTWTHGGPWSGAVVDGVLNGPAVRRITNRVSSRSTRPPKRFLLCAAKCPSV
jgi:acetylornithine deacetylase/succinyl-diaminopimelate desuccinylase-like protein